MDKRIFVKQNFLMIQLPREVDQYKAKEIREKADEALNNPEVEHIVFDFAETEFMDSSGIGIIVGRYQKISCLGGRVYAVHVSERIKRILYLGGLQRFLEIVDCKTE